MQDKVFKTNPIVGTLKVEIAPFVVSFPSGDYHYQGGVVTLPNNSTRYITVRKSDMLALAISSPDQPAYIYLAQYITRSGAVSRVDHFENGPNEGEWNGVLPANEYQPSRPAAKAAVNLHHDTLYYIDNTLVGDVFNRGWFLYDQDSTFPADDSDSIALDTLSGRLIRKGSTEPDRTVSYVSDHPGTLTMGMAVCLIAGQLRRATNASPYNVPIGLLYEDTLLQGVAGRVQTDLNLTMPALAWGDATGMVGGLAPGQIYFLTSTGAITPFAPSVGYIVPVGLALSSTTFRISFNSSVKL